MGGEIRGDPDRAEIFSHRDVGETYRDLQGVDRDLGRPTVARICSSAATGSGSLPIGIRLGLAGRLQPRIAEECLVPSASGDAGRPLFSISEGPSESRDPGPGEGATSLFEETILASAMNGWMDGWVDLPPSSEHTCRVKNGPDRSEIRSADLRVGEEQTRRRPGWKGKALPGGAGTRNASGAGDSKDGQILMTRFR